MKRGCLLSSLLFLFSLFFGAEVTILAQDKPVVTAADYARAERFLQSNTAPLLFNDRFSPDWIDSNTFWYISNSREGNIYMIVDARKGSSEPLFENKALAGALASFTGREIDSESLRLSGLKVFPGGDRMEFVYDGEMYEWSRSGNNFLKSGAKPIYSGDLMLSPDGAKGVFIRDYNLWIREITTGEEKQLTRDGIEDYGYATNNAGWTRGSRPVAKWSPDSRRIATFRHDGRGVGEMYLATTNVGHPQLDAWRYPLPGDSLIFRIERMVIDTETGDITWFKMGPDAHRSTITDHIAVRGGDLADTEWSNDSRRVAFVSVSRDHRDVTLRVADAETGEVTDILNESDHWFFESGYNSINWRFLDGSDEIIWYSRRSNHGHLYLYDLKDGKLKNTITEGEWNVLQVVGVDTDKKVIYFAGNGREKGDPYYSYLYSIRFNGKGLTLLTPDYANHNVTMSPGFTYFTDSYSTPVEPPVSVVAGIKGKRIYTLEQSDITDLINSGWVPPVPFTVKARDGVTDLYGLMHKPSNFDPSRKYPIINYIYPGPQSGSVGSRSFSAARSDRQAIAELGFIVVAIDAMGTPMRSQSFHAAYYGNMGDNGLPDQVTGMQQLAEKYEWIDIDRVGIYGHSGGGFASTAAMFRYPDFFKVAVSSAGNHDNRNYEDDWGEKWQGLLEVYPDGSTSYDNQANQLQASNLKGKLLLAHGTMDSNVPPYNTLLVVNELIAANKDFDLILFPNRGHGFGNESYMMRRRWDYFVKHLLGAEPPENYEIGAAR